MNTDKRNKDGTFGKGNKGKPKGAISEKAKIAEIFKSGLLSLSGDVIDVLKEMKVNDPEKFLKYFCVLSNYVFPKINHNINESTEPTRIIFENASKEFNFDKDGNITKK